MTLSTGQARRALIARALVRDPEVLVSTSRAPASTPRACSTCGRSMRALAQAGKSIVLVTHYPEDIIPEINRVVLVKDGAVFATGRGVA